jgi:hypothetical protein
MYSKSAWGGETDPYISVSFMKTESGGDPVVSLIIYEWKDFDYIGLPNPEMPEEVRGRALAT